MAQGKAEHSTLMWTRRLVAGRPPGLRRHMGLFLTPPPFWDVEQIIH